MSDRADNLEELRAALRGAVAEVARALLGEPSRAHSTRRTLRWGGKGSLAVEVSGPKQGLWFTHEGGAGGDLLRLIRHVQGCTFPEALDWARARTGIAADDSLLGTKWKRPEPLPGHDAEAAAERAAKIATAQRIVAGAVPIAGTLGEYYLKQVRGIPMPAAGWPSSVMWHSGRRAVLVVATADGAVQAVQRIHLAVDGCKVGAQEAAARGLRAVKVTNGPQDGAAVRLPGCPTGALLLAEGPETALAAHSSSGLETWVALGAVGKLEPPLGRRVAVIADDNPPAHDARFGQAAKALRDAVQRWRQAGIDYVVVTHWEVRRRDKSDLADVILTHGVDAVRSRIMAALKPVSTAPLRLPVSQARMAVGEAVGAFFEKVNAASLVAAKWDAAASSATAGAWR